jgi:hypothetical protein
MPRFHLQPEKALSQALAAKADIPEGLRFSYSRVGSPGGREPALWIFEHPAPEALVVRSGFGAGRILLSRGALTSSNEETLRLAPDGVFGHFARRGHLAPERPEHPRPAFPQIAPAHGRLALDPVAFARFTLARPFACRAAGDSSLAPALARSAVPRRGRIVRD